MWSGSQHKDAAWQLMKYLTGPDAQKAESPVWPPNNPKTWQELGWDKDPIHSVSYNQLLKGDKVANYLRSQYYFDCVYPHLSNIRTLWIEKGQRDMAALLKQEIPPAQQCLDQDYAKK